MFGPAAIAKENGLPYTTHRDFGSKDNLHEPPAKHVKKALI